MSAYSSGSGLNQVGGSTYSGAPAIGTTTLVAGGANLNGIIVRSFVLASAGAGQACVLYAGAAQIGAASANYVWSYAPIMLPPGQALAINNTAAGAGANVSYDIL